MAELQDTDKLLVNRDGQSHFVETQNLMNTIQDTDLLLVNRSDVSYKVTGLDLKDSLNNEVDPDPDSIVINPSVPGSGTELDPYILTPITVQPAGGTGTSVENITITGREGQLVIWTTDNTRFEQPVNVFDQTGQWTGKLVYQDTPATLNNTNYIGSLQIGTTYFQWQVNQLTTASTYINELNLTEVDPAGARFNSQSFLATTKVIDGSPIGTKTFEAHVNGTISSKTQFDEPLDSYSETTAGEWTKITFNTIQNTDIEYGLGRSVVAKTVFPWLMESTDLITWNDVNISSDPGIIFNCIGFGTASTGDNAGSEMFVALGNGTGAYSLDGLTWEAYTNTKLNDSGVEENIYLTKISYANGVFVALGNTITAYSTDGINWTTTPVPESDAFNPSALVYGTPSTGPDAGTPIFIGFSTTTQRTITSYDGINWVYTRGDTLVRQYGATYGNGKFVTVARYGEIRWSTDGLNWNLITIPNSVTLNHVAFGNDRFVAVTNTGTTTPVFIYSYDGLNWVETTYITTSESYGRLKFIEGLFVALSVSRLTVSASGTGENEQVLNFANGTDMSPLAAGDRISQTRNFNAQVTSSLTQTTNINEIWVNFLTAEGGWNASYPPENIFDGDLTTAGVSNKSITWFTGTFPLSGTLGLVVNNYTQAYNITVEHGGGTYEQSFLTTTCAQIGSSNIRIIELPYLSNITQVKVDRNNTTSTLYGIILDGEIVTTGTRLEVDKTTLSLPDGTDVSQLAVGDIVTGNTFAHDNSKLWREAPIFDDGGYAPAVSSENTFSISNAFNGEKCYNYIRSATPELGGTWTLNFTDFDDAQELVIYIAAAGQAYSVNGSAKDAGPEEFYKVIPVSLTGGLQQFTWSQVDASNFCYLLAMEIDGQLLVDSDVDRFKEPEVVATTSVPATVTVSPSTWANGAEVNTGEINIESTVTTIKNETVYAEKYPSTWVTGTNVTGPEKTQVTANTRLYCEFDSQGNITDLLQEPQDPPYTTQNSNPSLTFTFPATFPSGSTPDEELTAGTTFTVDVTSANTTGSDFRTASVQPGETLVQFDEPLESSNTEPLRYSDYLIGSFEIESRFAFGAGDGFDANTTNSSAYALTNANNNKVIFDCSGFPLTGEVIWAGATEDKLTFTVTSSQGVQSYLIEGTDMSTFNRQYALPSLTEITRIEVQGEDPLVIRGISVNRITLIDEDANVKSLNFADGTDMATLSTGDTVTQQRSFSETVESSNCQTVSIEKTWEDYVPTAVRSSYPAAQAFDGKFTTFTYGDTIGQILVWDTSTFPFSGTLSIAFSNDNNRRYFVNIYHENGIHSEAFLTTTLGKVFDTTLKKYVAPPLVNISRVEVSLETNYFRVYAFLLDDIIFKTGQPLALDTSVLTFADGTDMSSLRPGDRLTGNQPYWDQSTTWSEAPIFNDNGFNAQYAVSQGFDGSVYPAALASTALPVNGGNFTFNFTQFDDAEIVKLTIFSRNGGLKINGEEKTLISTVTGWYTMAFDVTGQGLQSIDISYLSPNYVGLKSVEVDGRLLVNPGIVNYEDASSWNQSREWSDGPTSGTAATVNYTWANIFSKTPDPTVTVKSALAATAEAYRIDFDPPIPVNNKLEILGARGNINDATRYYNINDGEKAFQASVTYTSNSIIQAWDTVPDVTELSSLEISTPTAVAGQTRLGTIVSGIRIDDKLLVDSSVVPDSINLDPFPVSCISVNSTPPTATTTAAGWTAGSVLSNGDLTSTGTVDDIVDTTVTLTPSSSINWVDGVNVTGPVTAATRSQSPEEFSESQARFMTYLNRSMIKCGEDALAQRQAIVDDAANLGIDISELYDSN